MPRHDSTMRAARFLLGAGMMVAVLAATADRASAQTTECIGEVPTVCGHVFADVSTSDDAYQLGEGQANVTVVLTDSDGNVVAMVNNPKMTDCSEGVEQPGCGYYSFDVNEPGDYWVCLVLPGQTMDCSDPAMHPESQPVTGGLPGQTADFEIPSNEPPPPVWGVGTGTPGYWKNHPEAWPGPVSVGGVTYVLDVQVHPNLYDAIKLMGKVSGDKTYSMFAALISTKLNTMLDNNTSCITDTIGKADAWMSAHPVGSIVKASSPAWAEADTWHQLLDDYNNGKLCAPHRD